MEYTPLSPFMRPISHANLRVVERTEATVPDRPINKWELLRELSKAQTAFGITERDLTVLQGLLSFFPHDALGGNAEMIVFPSNKTICERLNGMPCSTMRRHLSRLIDSGLLTRRDSPNGKRYARRHGDERIAFGFDLTPLFRRAEEIARAADEVRMAESSLKRLRVIVSLMRRDLAALAEFGQGVRPDFELWQQLHDAADAVAKALRRKLSAEVLGEYRTKLEVLLDHARSVIDGPETEHLNSNAAQIEQHHHSSNKEAIDSEPSLEKPAQCNNAQNGQVILLDDRNDQQEMRQMPNIPLHLVTAACPSLGVFYQGEVRHWHQLFAAACHMRPAMGISLSAWEDAQRCMGPEQASVVMVAMLERFAEIKSPGGYLRALTTKAASGEFSCGPMVMALIGKQSAA
ncbi:replication initiation protein [Paracoccus gahaiensis]|uniref:Replication initiation protein n=1 Tax=Paracoccus gahaiensis TaxID=1706839 RepID=A0A4V5MUU0_9RHOB|nr:plasmid replication protein RepC [Paracoccus gahaiensis]TJZ89038.1 replication initiation protein [Paracoccus gahaiensis]